MESVIVVPSRFELRNPNLTELTVTTRVAGRPLQRDMESARPSSSTIVETYTTPRDATSHATIWVIKSWRQTPMV